MIMYKGASATFQMVFALYLMPVIAWMAEGLKAFFIWIAALFSSAQKTKKKKD